jgi:hypothetical protein
MRAGTISLEELVFSLPGKACDAVLSVNDGTIGIQVLHVPEGKRYNTISKATGSLPVRMNAGG